MKLPRSPAGCIQSTTSHRHAARKAPEENMCVNIICTDTVLSAVWIGCTPFSDAHLLCSRSGQSHGCCFLLGHSCHRPLVISSLLPAPLLAINGAGVGSSSRRCCPCGGRWAGSLERGSPSSIAHRDVISNGRRVIGTAMLNQVLQQRS